MEQQLHAAHLKYSPLKLILIAGLIGGTFDASAAIIDVYLSSGATPDVVFRYIAAGVFGPAALEGSIGMVIWGIIFHFTIAIGWASIFYLAYKNIPVVRENPIIAGAIYGLIVWLLMNSVVVPLSQAPHRPLYKMRLIGMLKGSAYIIFLLGIPVAFITHKIVSTARAAD
jgi:hypothetical protein